MRACLLILLASLCIAYANETKGFKMNVTLWYPEGNPREMTEEELRNFDHRRGLEGALGSDGSSFIHDQVNINNFYVIGKIYWGANAEPMEMFWDTGSFLTNAPSTDCEGCNYTFLFDACNDATTIKSDWYDDTTYLDGSFVEGHVYKSRAGLDDAGTFSMDYFPYLALNGSNQDEDGPLFDGIVGLAQGIQHPDYESDWLDAIPEVDSNGDQLPFEDGEEYLFMNHLLKNDLIEKRQLGVYFTNYDEGNHMYFGGFDTSFVNEADIVWKDLYYSELTPHWDIEGGDVTIGSASIPLSNYIEYATLDTGTTLSYFPHGVFSEMLNWINGYYYQ